MSLWSIRCYWQPSNRRGSLFHMPSVHHVHQTSQWRAAGSTLRWSTSHPRVSVYRLQLCFHLFGLTLFISVSWAVIDSRHRLAVNSVDDETPVQTLLQSSFSWTRPLAAYGSSSTQSVNCSKYQGLCQCHINRRPLYPGPIRVSLTVTNINKQDASGKKSNSLSSLRLILRPLKPVEETDWTLENKCVKEIEVAFQKCHQRGNTIKLNFKKIIINYYLI